MFANLRSLPLLPRRSSRLVPASGLALALFASPAAAATWVVDAAGGAGSNFRTLAAAETAAAPGDIVIVRPGTYAPFRTAKGISVFGQPGAVVRGLFNLNPLEVRGLPAGQGFALFGLRLEMVLVQLADCRGRVLLERIESDGYLRAERCAEVWIDECKITPANQIPLVVNDSAVALADSELTGPIVQAWFSLEAISATNSRLSLSRCKLCVCSTFQSTLLSPAIAATNCDLLVTGDGSGYLRSRNAQGPGAAIVGSGRLTLDPRVSLSAAPRGGITVTRKTVPTLSATSAKLGSTLTLDAVGGASDSYFLFVSLPFGPITVPSYGDLWMSGADPRRSGRVRRRRP